MFHTIIRFIPCIIWTWPAIACQGAQHEVPIPRNPDHSLTSPHNLTTPHTPHNLTTTQSEYLTTLYCMPQLGSSSVSLAGRPVRQLTHSTKCSTHSSTLNAPHIQSHFISRLILDPASGSPLEDVQIKLYFIFHKSITLSVSHSSSHESHHLICHHLSHSIP